VVSFRRAGKIFNVLVTPESAQGEIGMRCVILSVPGLVVLGLAIFPLKVAFFLATEGLGIIKWGQFLLIAAIPLSISTLLLWKAASGWGSSLKPAKSGYRLHLGGRNLLSAPEPLPPGAHWFVPRLQALVAAFLAFKSHDDPIWAGQEWVTFLGIHRYLAVRTQDDFHQRALRLVGIGGSS
jgi:hypothetical protein